MAGEKRSASESGELVCQESVILLDIEGTTTSISFVKDTLFPYVREFLKKHVDEKWETEEFKADFVKLKEQAKEDEEKKIEGFVPIKEDSTEEAKESLVKNVLWQMDNDRKAGALKDLQGHMWQAAYKTIKGHVYDDVPEAFEKWTTSDKKLYIYSSGSVLAQKLLYGNTEHGDLLKYISGHFDTSVGQKQEAQSYKKILDEIKAEPSNVIFLTDVPKEAEAAKAAGLSAIIVVREGNAKLSDEDKAAYKTIESFAELSFQSPSKRQKLDEEIPAGEEKDSPSDDKPSKTAEPAPEPMDTSEDAEPVKTVDGDVDGKVESTAETIEENKTNGVAPVEKEEEEEAKSAAKEISATETTDSAEKSDTVVAGEKSKAVGGEAEKSPEKTESKPEEPVQKAEAEEPVVEKKAAEEVTEKTEESVAADVVKENGDAKVEESKTDGEKKAEPEAEVAAGEAKENDSSDKAKEEVAKPEVEAQPKDTESKQNGTTTNGDATKDVAGEKVQTNGVSGESKENGAVVEDSIKVKKPLADGNGETDVVSPPVVAATS
ncbi:enolase-phosphatase E1 [Copidosoma floridanum]|uniref:enolase-phosphatase E1 n=1 Tax=Copidosoma floridanum TaxID=29053 RepID=UPI0006C95AFB|nr:enolase-phosphatase E1 [Copidosoma floridanum]